MQGLRGWGSRLGLKVQNWGSCRGLSKGCLSAGGYLLKGPQEEQHVDLFLSQFPVLDEFSIT